MPKVQRELLSLEADSKGIVLSRPNRFTVEVIIEGNKELAHLHDPGRLKELIYPTNSILLKRAFSANRKTKWDVIAANSPAGWVFLNSAYHRILGERIIDSSIFPYKAKRIKAEVKINNSRLDYLVDTERGRIWIELKGCTLSVKGTALFPDAPTSRGTRHLREMIELAERGERCMLLVLVMRKDATSFAPNRDTDPEFAKAFWEATEKGVEVLPVKLAYDGRVITLEETLPVVYKTSYKT